MNAVQGTYSFGRPGVFQQHGAALVRLGRITDTVIITLMLVAVYQGRPWFSDRSVLVDAVICFAVLECVAPFFNFNRSWRIVRMRYEMFDLVAYWTLGFMAIVGVFMALGDLTIVAAAQWMPLFARWYIAALLTIIAFRAVQRLFLRYYRAFGHDLRNTALIGATETAQQLQWTFAMHPWMGLRTIGVFDDRDPAAGRLGADDAGAGLSGNVDALYALARAGRVSCIYITLPMAAEERIKRIIDRFGDTTASVYYCPPLSGFDLIGGRWDNIFGQPVISIVESPFEGYSGAVKRAEDLVLAAIILPLVAPVMLVCAILIKLGSRGPVLYRQTRYGLDGKPFQIWKFRSMYVARDDGSVQATKGDSRVTPIGRILRRTSLDELPQLFNVLAGSMSVVGPRPHPVALNEKFRPVIHRYMVRHKIKPGITGLAQINGWRGETETLDKMHQRIKQDIEYLRCWSVGLDLRILIRSVIVPITDKAY